MNPELLSFTSERRFGTESEILSYDKRDFKVMRLNADLGEMPQGIDDVAFIVADSIKQEVTMRGWHSTHNNNQWVLKPDSSCGIEICSPVSKGWNGLQKICRVTQDLAADKMTFVDDRCGFHVHVDVGDTDIEYIGSILAYWIKFEHLFLDAMPDLRKRNRYCQSVALSSIEIESPISVTDIIRRLGVNKYLSINTFHMNKGRRNTLEFRIMDAEGCINAFIVKNWVRLLLHFVEQARMREVPHPFENGNKWSGLCWLDLRDFMSFMNFNASPKITLSGGMIQMRNWFLARMKKNIDSQLSGIWSPQARQPIKNQLLNIWKELELDEEPDEYLNPGDMETALYGLQTRQ